LTDRHVIRSGGRSARALRIFLSYRREDAAAYAGRIYDALVQRFGEANVFMDVDTIELGSDFTETIDLAISSCDVVIALIGRSWLSATDQDGRRRLDDPDDVLRIELERALSGGLVVIPACVQEAELPSEGELPGALAPLATRQGIELRDSAWHDDIGRLIRRLEGLSPKSADAGEANQGWRTPGTQRSRRKWIFAALVVIALAALAVVLAIVLTDSGNSASGGSGSSKMSPADQKLLRLVPADIRSGCLPYNADGPKTATASVSCDAVRLNVAYSQFRTRAAMNDWYLLAREDANIQPFDGACTSSRFHGETRYMVGGKAAGRQFCFLDDKHEPQLAWTDERPRRGGYVGGYIGVWEGAGRPAIESLLRQWQCCLQPLT